MRHPSRGAADADGWGRCRRRPWRQLWRRGWWRTLGRRQRAGRGHVIQRGTAVQRRCFANRLAIAAVVAVLERSDAELVCGELAQGRAGYHVPRSGPRRARSGAVRAGSREQPGASGLGEFSFMPVQPLRVMCTPTQDVWQPAGCVSRELVCVCVSLVRVVIICLASTHTALVSSPSLTVLHLPTYIHTCV